jgi:hypothetical protein
MYLCSNELITPSELRPVKGLEIPRSSALPIPTTLPTQILTLEIPEIICKHQPLELAGAHNKEEEEGGKEGWGGEKSTEIDSMYVTISDLSLPAACIQV